MRRYLICLAVSVLILVPVLSAAPCSSTDCTYTFDTTNGGSGITGTTFGTVELELIGGDIEAIINVDPGFKLIGTGFPGTFGFNDTTGGTMTATSSDPSNYSGTLGSTANAEHFDGFGYFKDAAGTTAPSAGSSHTVSSLTFTISTSAGAFTNVDQLVQQSATPAGSGQMYFVADVFQGNGGCGGGGCTGLIGVSSGTGFIQSVPEPTSYAALLAGLGALAFVIQRRERRRKNSILAE